MSEIIIDVIIVDPIDITLDVIVVDPIEITTEGKMPDLTKTKPTTKAALKQTTKAGTKQVVRIPTVVFDIISDEASHPIITDTMIEIWYGDKKYRLNARLVE